MPPQPPSFSSFRPPSSEASETPKSVPAFPSFATGALDKGKQRAIDPTADEDWRRRDRTRPSRHGERTSHRSGDTRKDPKFRKPSSQGSEHLEGRSSDRGQTHDRHRPNRVHDEGRDTGEGSRRLLKVDDQRSRDKYHLGSASNARPRRRPRSPEHDVSHRDRRHDHRHQISHHHQQGQTTREEPMLEPDKELFFVDTRGDRNALNFGPDASHFPRFDRGGGRLVLGLDRSHRLTRQSVKLRGGEALEVSSRGEGSSRTSNGDTTTRWKKLRTSPRRLLPSKSTSAEIPSDFISVSTRRSAGRDPGFSILSNILAEMGDPESTDEASSDSDDANARDGAEGRQALDGKTLESRVSFKSKARQLQHRLRDTPTDVAAWLDMADLQDHLAASDSLGDLLTSTSDRSSKKRPEREQTHASRKRAVLDVKFAVLDKAVTAHPDNRSSLPLLLGRLQIAIRSGRWDGERVEREWRRLFSLDVSADAVATSTVLWPGYLSWKRSEWFSFELRTVLDLHKEALASISAKLADSEAARPEQSWLIDAALLSILRDYLEILSEVGRREQALATIQALIEINLCAPSRSAQGADNAAGRSFKLLVEECEHFWNSGQARVMEEGAHGWGRSNCDDRPTLPKRPLGPRAHQRSTPQDHPVDRWLESELRRSDQRDWPARLDDVPDWQADGEDIDPFSIILFSDIRPMLVDLRTPRGKVGLLDLALSFTGLPAGLLLGLSASLSPDLGIPANLARVRAVPSPTHASFEDSRFWPTALRDGETQAPIFEYIEGQMMERTRTSSLTDPTACPVASTVVAVEDLFDAASECGSQIAACLRSLDPQCLTLTTRLLSQVAPYVDMPAAPVLHLALESARSPKAATRLAKKLLSDSRDNLVLWHAYAQHELSAGRVEQSRSIYITALESSAALQSSDDRTRRSLSAIWASLIDLEVRAGKDSSAAAVICAAARSAFALPPKDMALRAVTSTAAMPSGVEALRARRAMRSLVGPSETNEEARNPWSTADLAVGFCLVLFDYVMAPAGEGLLAAMTTFRELIKHSEEHRESAQDQHLLEPVYLKMAALVRRHILVGKAFRPKEVRDLLDDALAACPASTALWSHLAAHEMRSKIDNYLRLSLDTHLSSLEKHSVARALLQTSAAQLTARTSDVTEQSAHWLLAVYFELNMHTQHFSEEAVRRLFERAIDGPVTSGVATLWSSYLDFETRLLRTRAGSQRQFKQQQSRTKSLLYRAIKACPGSKSIYLFAFRRPLREAMNLEEISSLWEVMCEKGIRVFVELDDFLDGWRRDSTIDQGDQSEQDPMEVDSEDTDSDFDDPFDPNQPYKKRDDKYEQVGGGPSREHRRASLHSLPVELLYSIFVLAHSSALPAASRGLRDVFHRAPLGVKVEYVLEKWHEEHLKNLATWRDTRFRACLCGYRRAVEEPHVTPPPGFWNRSSILSPGTLAPCCGAHLNVAANVDPISYAARFGICTADLVVRLELRLVQIDSIRAVLEDHRRRLDRQAAVVVPSLEQLVSGEQGGAAMTRVELPKRIFRSLKQVELGPCPSALVDKDRRKKRRRNGNEVVETAAVTTKDAVSEAQDRIATLHGFRPELLSLLPYFLASSNDSIGAMPASETTSLLLLLLERFAADANSHSGFPLAMSVHSDCWALVNVLLAYGADPAKKEGLAVQIAVRKGRLDGLRGLVERDGRLEKRWSRAVFAVMRYVEEMTRRWWVAKVPDLFYQQHASRGVAIVAGSKAERHGKVKGVEDEEPTSTSSLSSKRRKLPDRFTPDSRHLREAIKEDRWDIVQYLMQEKLVVPDIKALQLMERKGM